jgi:glycopeptide antibiotics resistance protein
MFQQLLHLFFSYRSLVAPILIVGSIVVPCWLLLRVYRLRTAGRRPSFRRELLLLGFVAYLSALAAVTLMPNQSSRVVAEGAGGIELRPDLAALTCSPAVLPSGADRGFCVRNARGNVMLFFPLGILLPLVWRRLRFWRAIQVAIGISFGIELVQYLSSAWGSYRAADLNDVILNGLGASLGLGLVFLLRLLRGTHPDLPRAQLRSADRPTPGPAG